MDKKRRLTDMIESFKDISRENKKVMEKLNKLLILSECKAMQVKEVRREKDIELSTLVRDLNQQLRKLDDQHLTKRYNLKEKIQTLKKKVKKMEEDKETLIQKHELDRKEHFMYGLAGGTALIFASLSVGVGLRWCFS